jgi:transcriptional regulator of heat shock response
MFWHRRIEAKLSHLTEIVYLLRMELKKGFSNMANILDALQAEVTKVEGVEDSAIALLQGLSQQLKDALAANDPAKIQAIIDELDAKTTALAVAVTANTPPAL